MRLVTIAAALCVFATSAAAAPLVDFSFEDRTLAPGEVRYNPAPFQLGVQEWSFAAVPGGAALVSNGSLLGLPDAPDGTQVAVIFHTDEAASAVSQRYITLDEGDWYEMSFFVATVPGLNYGTASAIVNGSRLGFFEPPTDGSFAEFTTRAFQATASNRIAFGTGWGGRPGYPGPNGVAIDAVSLRKVASPPAVVPEPSTWALLIMGFGWIGGLARSNSGRVQHRACEEARASQRLSGV